MKLGNDGRYEQITVKIADDIPENECDTLLKNLKVSFEKILC